ncbi:MAG: hypothetical protein AAB370_01340 [Verrucomicrobiota bacterium]
MSANLSVILQSENIRKASPELFQILEELFPVKFASGVMAGSQPLGGILLTGEQGGGAGVPTVEMPRATAAGNEASLIEAKIVFSDDAEVPFPFRGRALPSKVAAGFVALKLAAGETALASIEGQVIWSLRKTGSVRHYRTGLPLPQIPEGGNFQNLFNGERFLELLPLVHWLRQLCGENEYQGLPLRAQFMFDDPNLHWPSYGYVDYREIAARAEKANYHVSFATVPLDNWFTHQPTAKIFRENPRRLSLLVHGNNHVHQELLQNYTPEDRVFLLRQALQRIEQLEAAAKVGVSRAMAAPHGACSEEMLAELPKCGFVGATISHGSLRAHNRSRPWVKSLGYRPAEIIKGCAVMPRWRLASNAHNTILLAAYLRQPIILVGHHGDLKAGLELLDGLAGFINSLGTVAWLDTAELAEINYRWRMEDDVFRLQPLGSRVRVKIPNGTKSLIVDHGGQVGWQTWRVTSAGAAARSIEAGTIVNLSGATDEELLLEVPVQPSVKLDEISNRRIFRPFVRRLATEARDRLVALVR